MLKIGITGGIGSGKTTVCRIFETLGIPVYYADERARWLMNNAPHLIVAIKSLLGGQAYGPDGRLDRAYVAGIVFEDHHKLSQLNALVHPAVALDADRWHQNQTGVPYTLKEAALLFESGSYQQLDRIIVVTAPLELRIHRVMARDETTREAVEARIDKQMPEAEKVERADFVVNNDGSHPLIEQVLAIHQALKNLLQEVST